MNFIPKVFELIKRPTTSKYRSAVYSNVYDKTYDAYHFPGSKRNAQTLVYPLLLGWVVVRRQPLEKKQSTFFSPLKGETL
jgi:hypothetical protein